MKILFLIEDWPITPDGYGGGAVLFYNHLQLLVHAGHQISVVMLFNQSTSLGYSEFIEKQPEVCKTINSWITSQHRLVYKKPIRPRSKLASLIRRDLSAITHSFINNEVIKEFNKLVSCIQPDLVWAEHLVPAILATKALKGIPIIYSHHDWAWKIKSLRYYDENPKSFKSWIKFFLLKRVEKALIHKVTASISASATEASELRLGCENVGYFPPIYEQVNLDDVDNEPSNPRIVHLGGMRTTATKQGLQRFLDIVWPSVCKLMAKLPELLVVGDLRGASNSFLLQLKESGAHCMGFVQDLSSALKPYDIHVIPWEYNTGVRTRLVLAFNYSQVVIATRASVACFPEVRHRHNCILVDNLSEMAEEISALCSNKDLRKQLGVSARETFLQSFTQQALQGHFNVFLEGVASKSLSR